MGFDGKSGLRAARRTRLRARNLIGVDAKSFDLDRRNAIVTRRPPRSLNGNFGIGLERGVTAAAENRAHMHGAKLSSAIDAGAERNNRGMTM